MRIRSILRKSLNEIERFCLSMGTANRTREWIVDNQHLIGSAGESIKRSFPRREERLLTKRKGGFVLYDAIREYIDDRAVICDFDDICRHFAGVAGKENLSSYELWLFPMLYRLALVEKIANICRSGEDAPTDAANAVTALRESEFLNWQKAMERISPASEVYMQNAVYREMTDDSRSEYLRRTAYLARRRKIPESEIAKKALEYEARRRRHFGYYLYPRAGRDAAAAYVMAGAAAAVFISAVIWIATGSALFSIFALIPVHAALMQKINGMILRLTPPRMMPEIERFAPTIIVTTTVIASKGDVDALIEKLKAQSVGKCLCGALCDFTDSDTEKSDADEDIIRYVKERENAFFEEYGQHLYFFIRKRRQNSANKKYFGWERKRGALIELSRYLRGEGDPFCALTGDKESLKGVKFIITLDSDTEISPDNAQKLVGSALHPMAERYTFLMPHILCRVDAASASAYSRIQNSGGADVYHGASRGVYQDFFARASFTGKGIFDVDKFLSRIDGFFPENAVLSHDLVEGEAALCAECENVEAFDGCPSGYTAHALREARWIRGDWQNVRYLFKNIRNERGEKLKNPFDLLSKWKIFDNLLRSQIPLSLLGLIFCSIIANGAFCLVAALLLFALIYPGVGRFICAVAFLPHAAYNAGVSAAKGLWRISDSARALEWTTAKDAEAKRENSIYKYMSVCCFAAAAMAAAAAFSPPAFRIIGLIISVIWAFAPLFADTLSQKTQKVNLTDEEKDFLTDCAKSTWRFFDKTVTKDDNFIPPDNIQLDPDRGIAHRTSPTNIGLYLMSAVAAQKMGIIRKEELFSRLSDTLDTLGSLERWNGHLLNWYDTRSLSPLYPRYVSTVDSGNLVCAMVAVSEALKIIDAPKDLISRCKEYSQADFSPLYDSERHLFSIGMNLESGALTDSHYDLAASEALLTSYFALSHGAPQKHWRHLSRALRGSCRFPVLASWTGTMFEYLMPRLLLEMPRDSIFAKSCENAVRHQMQSAQTVWGRSESAFFETDINQSYCYKAFGEKSCAMKPSRGDDEVFAPYASFLALPVDADAAIKNLLEMRAMCAMGEYGFYEAIDFENAPGGGFAIVKSHMAHHQGMIMASIANALFDNFFVKCFNSDPYIASQKTLLQERMPRRASIVRIKTQEEAKPLEGDYEKTLSGEFCAHAIALGEFSAFCDTRGVGFYRRGEIFFGAFSGAYGEEGGEKLYFDGEPFAPDSVHFTKDKMELSNERCGINVSLDKNGARIEKITAPKGTKICRSIDVILSPPKQHYSHTAFSKLFLECETMKNALLIRRQTTEGGEIYGAYIAAGEGARVSFSDGKIFAEFQDGENYIVSFIAKSREAALEAIEKYRSADGFAAPHTDIKAPPRALATAYENLKRIAYCDVTDPQREAAAKECREGADALWRLGLSGDFPIVTLNMSDESQKEELCDMIVCHKIWEKFGFTCELFILCDDKTGYISPIMELARETVGKSHLKNRENMRGGVFICDGKTVDRTDRALLRAASRIFSGGRESGALKLPERERTAPCDAFSPDMSGLKFYNGYGGFDGDEYVIYTDEEKRLPAPWINVLSNEDFGFLVNERGGSFTWAHNARELKITQFDFDGERIFIETDGVKYDPLSGGITCRHGYGYSVFSSRRGGISHEYTVFAAREKRAKIGILKIKSDSPRKIKLTYEVDALLSDDKRNCAMTERTGSYARLGGREAFWSVGEGELDLAAGDEKCVVFCLSYSEKLTPDIDAAENELSSVKSFWQDLLTQTVIKTPSEKINTIANGHLLYQTLACRMWARCGAYQCGGAQGFRDQLQDSLALLDARRDLARKQILYHASRQFEEGDALHWWHEMPDSPMRGVRTRISDDRLWLVYVTARYIEATGDLGVLDENVPFLSAPPLAENEKDRYFSPGEGERGTLYEHCLRAIDITAKLGARGLLKMGGGDWNDGMNEVYGESVWLTLFMIETLRLFLPYIKNGEKYAALREELISRVNENAWDGKWYLRAFYDDGEKIGAKGNPVCEIDLLSQSWAAIALGENLRTRTALDAAHERLFDEKRGILKLLTPPFDKNARRAGYISAYPKGVRENGGQYTHAAVWAAMANLRLGNPARGVKYLEEMLPISHSDTKEKTDLYRLEPYAVAADIGIDGRGGWSWYTGSAAWLYDAVLRTLCGIKRRGDTIVVEPHLPSDWNGVNVSYRFGKTVYEIEIRRTGEIGENVIRLIDDQKAHKILITI